MKKITKHSLNASYINSSALYRAAFAALVIAAAPTSSAWALPTGGVVNGGSATITQPNANNLVINQTSNRAIIDWRSFNILNGESTRFNQPGANSVALNRIHDGNPSQILGSLSANGKLVLVNPNGVFFGVGSRVDVAGLVASTADMSNTDFMAGRTNFNIAGRADASIINKGTITAAEGGLVALVAPSVRNDGVIQAKAGAIRIGAADTFTVDFYGDNLYSFALGNKTTKAGKDENGNNLTSAIENNGTISANGGSIVLTANAAKDIVTNAVNNTGVIEATSARMVNGTIVLGGGNGNVRVAGKVKASGDVTVTAGTNIQVGGNGANGGNGPDGTDAFLGFNGITFNNARNGANGGDGSISTETGKITLTAGNDIQLGGNGANGGNGGNGGNGANGANGRFINFDGGDGGNGANGGNGGNGGTGTLSSTSGAIQLTAGRDVIIGSTRNGVAGTAGTRGNNATGTRPGAGGNAGSAGTAGQSANGSITSGTGSITIDGVRDIALNNSSVTTGGAVKIDPINVSLTSSSISGASVTIDPVTNLTLTDSTLTATAGDLTINNTGKFESNDANSLNATGKISLRQSVAGTIKNAIDAVGNYATAVLTLGSGTFAENISLVGNSNFTVTGQGATGANATIIAPTTLASAEAVSNGTPWSDQLYKSIVLVRDASAVTVSNLAIDGSSIASTPAFAGLTFYNAGGNATGVNINGGGNGTFGFYAVADSTQGHTAKTVTATNINSRGNSWSAVAVIGNVLTANITDSTLDGSAGQHGIDSSNGSRGTYTNNIITTGAATGVGFHGAHDVSIVGGSITGNGTASGIVDEASLYGVAAANNITVDGVTISNLRDGIVTNGGSNWNIKNNTIHTVSKNAVRAVNTGALSIDGNVVYNTGGNAVDVANSASASIKNNFIGFTDKVGGVGTAGNIKGDGIKLTSSNSSVITSNRVTETASTGFDIGSGIFVSNSDDVAVGAALGSQGNILTNIAWDGIKFSGGDRASIQNNSIDGVVRAGIYLGGVDTASVLVNKLSNVATNAVGAIESDNGSNLSITSNTVLSSNANGISVNNAAGTNKINGNTISNTKRNGVRVDNAAGLSVTDNTIGSTTEHGITIARSNGAKIENNDVTLASGNGIVVSASNDVVVGHATDRNFSNRLTNITGNGIDVANGARVTINGNSGNAIKGAAINVNGTAGARITGNSFFNVAANALGGIVTNNASDLFIRINSISSNKAGIVVANATGTNQILSNTVSKAATDGINVDNATNLSVDGNTIRNTGADGIDVRNSDGALINSNKVGFLNNGLSAGDNNIKGDGIFVDNSDNAVIAKNIITETSSTAFANGSGIQLLNSDGVTIGGLTAEDGNIITNAGWDGIRVADNSNLTVRNNSISNIALNGIYAGNTTKGTFADNSVTTSSLGGYGAISIDGGSNIGVLRNDVNDSRGSGIWLRNTTGTNRVNGNTISQTAQNGITVDNAAGLNVNNNLVRNTGANGVSVVNSNGASIKDNIIGFLRRNLRNAPDNNINGDGIFVNNSDNAVIASNTITETNSTGPDIGSGIQVLGSDGVTIGGATVADANVITNAGWDGIRVQDNSNLTVRNNNITNVALNGIYSGNTSTGTFADNSVSTSSFDNWGAISIDGGSNISVLRNDIDNSRANGILMQNTTGTNTIDGNIVDGVTLDGIHANTVSNLAITNNTVSNAGRDGIHANNLSLTSGVMVASLEGNNARVNARPIFLGRNQSVISGNTINDVIRDGINLESISNAYVVDNTINDTGRDGINASNLTVTNTRGLVKDIAVREGVAQGVIVEGESGLNRSVISGNRINVNDKKEVVISDAPNTERRDILTSGRDGIHVEGSENTLITENTIRNVGRDGINVRDLTVTESLIFGKIPVIVNGEPVESEFGVIETILGESEISFNDIRRADRDGIHVRGTRLRVDGPQLVQVAVEGDAINEGGRQIGSLSINDNDIRNVNRDGINIRNLSDTSIKTNSIRNADRDGIRVTNSRGVTIETNTVSDTLTGIHVRGGSDDVLISGNTTSLNNMGIHAELSNNIRILTNTLTGDSFGILLDGVTVGSIADNILTAGKGKVITGISVSNSPAVVVDRNSVTDYFDGIGVRGSNGAFIRDNNVFGRVNPEAPAGSLPEGTGFAVVDSNNVVMSGNSVSNKNLGVFIDNAQGGFAFSNNTLTDNFIGVSLNNTDDAVFAGDIFTGNTLGIDLNNSRRTRLVDQTITTADGGTGIQLLNGSSDTVVSGLTLSGGTNGIVIDGALTPITNEGPQGEGDMVALLDEPRVSSSMQFEGNTSSFSDVDFYFVLQNGAMIGQTLDASQQFFDGTRASDFTLAQLNAAEAKTIDDDSTFTLGNVFFKDFPLAIRDEENQKRKGLYRTGLFSYAGRTLNNDVSDAPFTFNVSQLGTDLSLLNRQVTSPTTTPGIANLFANLAPAAGGNNQGGVNPNLAAQLAALNPSAGGGNTGGAPTGGDAGFVNDLLGNADLVN